MLSGQIVKLIGGLYVVEYSGKLVNCKARGLFRKQKISPCVGDFVGVEIAEDETGTIVEIYDRKNFLIRPPIANLDHMVIVVSTIDPIPNLVVLDKFLATMSSHGINTLIAVTKSDLATPRTIAELYRQVGYKTFEVSGATGEGTQALVEAIGTSLSAFAGNTGAGKSSLLNIIDPSLGLVVGETSKKLGRGKHTTRHVEIFRLANGLRVADTPGFSSMDILETTDITVEDLSHSFIEFGQYINQCKFNDCKHLSETECGVKNAVESGKIIRSRYDSYVKIYDEIKDVKGWQRR